MEPIIFIVFILLGLCVAGYVLFTRRKKGKPENNYQAASVIIHSPFDYLPQWEHESSKQKERQNRALALTDRIINIDYAQKQLTIQKDTGEGFYTASLIGCTCEDFTYRRLPCKHMYCLAFALYNQQSAPSISAYSPVKIGTVKSVLLQSDKIGKHTSSRFIAFDTETTGFSVTKDRIIEIGAVIFENGVPSAHFSSLINPHILTSPDAEKVNHISQEMINAAPPEETVFSDFTAFLGDALQGKTCLVAHNANFDRRFLEETLQRLGFDANLIFVDTLELSRKLIPGLKDYKLQTVAEHFDLNNKSAHRADSDAEICGMIFLKLLSKIQHETDNAVVKATQ